jgi:hypothetical protein
MAKRGPKRLRAKRYPCGQIKRVVDVAPTAELIAKRVARLTIAGVDPIKKKSLANTGLVGPEQDNYFRLASSWLGVLYAADVITAAQYKAGDKYHGLYKAMFPQGFPGSCLNPDMPTVRKGSALVPVQPFEPEETADDLGLAWKASERVLGALGRRTQSLVKNVAVFGRFERFIDTSSPRPLEAWNADRQDRTRFVCGLDALAMAYGYKAAHQEERRAA